MSKTNCIKNPCRFMKRPKSTFNSKVNKTGLPYICDFMFMKHNSHLDKLVFKFKDLQVHEFKDYPYLYGQSLKMVNLKPSIYMDSL